MQNKNIIWSFTILLTLACLYQLSFSWVASGVEKDAVAHANQEIAKYEVGDTSEIKVGNNFLRVDNVVNRSSFVKAVEEQYLINAAGKPAYPLLGHTYKYCKDNQLSQGLDLKGGMSVTLEVSISDMVKNLAGRYGKKPSFSKPYNSAYELFTSKGNELDFVTLFQQEYARISPDEKLAKVFKFKDENSKTLTDISNEKVFEILKEKADGALEKVATVINNRLSGTGLNEPTIQINKNSGTISVDMPGVKDKVRMRELLQGTAKLEFWHTYKNTEVGNAIYENVNSILSNTLYPGFKDSIDKLNDTSLLTEDSTTLNSEEIAETENTEVNDVDSVKDELAFDSAPTNFDNSIDNLSDEEKIEIGKKTAPLSSYLYPYVTAQGQWAEGSVLGYAKISDTAIINDYLAKDYVQNVLPQRDLAFMWESKPDPKAVTNDGTPLINLYLIKKTKSGIAELDGEEVQDARQDFDPVSNAPAVSLQFKTQGANAWADLTRVSAERGTGIAITLDNKVFSAPVASGTIEGGNTQITGGSFNGEDGIKEAESLAKILKAGALPAPAKIVDEAFVGPTLGAENVKAGLWSFAGALLLVLLYMIFYYAKAGAVADIALVSNIFFIFGTLASLSASLTLPGIAGIVLTIGMSVDANVLVFERIREELRKGRGNRQAITEGYSKALSAILDANVTTLLTAIVLGYFGSGPVKGFATTLIIGIFTSLFSALIITRLIFTYMMDGKKDISFSTKLTENFLVNANFGFVAKRKIFYAISGLVIIGGIASLATRSLDYGVEFTGGRTYKVQFDEAVNLDDVRKALTITFKDKPEVKMIDNEFKALITTQFMLEDKTSEGSKIVDAALAAGLKDISAFKTLESRQVDPNISAGFKSSSIYAIVFALIIIFFYIVLRFRKWQFGVGALVAMFHDVLIVLSLFSIGWGIFPFAMEINQAFIAAILTVVGYSINDTVVVFDRIREFLTEKRREDSSVVINQALNSTLTRTVNTSITTFLVLLVIFAFGGESIRGMIFALMIGVVVGTYSSLFIATPLVVDLSKKFDFKKKQKL